MKNEVTQDFQTKAYFIRRTERLQMVRLVTEKAFSYLWFCGTRINVISFTKTTAFPTPIFKKPHLNTLCTDLKQLISTRSENRSGISGQKFIYAPLYSTDFTALIFKKPLITQYFFSGNLVRINLSKSGKKV